MSQQCASSTEQLVVATVGDGLRVMVKSRKIKDVQLLRMERN